MERITMTVIEAAAALGISRNSAYAAIREGTFPVEVIRIGSRILVPRDKLIKTIEGDSK